MYWKVSKWKAEMFLIVFLMPAVKQNSMCLQFLHHFSSTKTFSLKFKQFLKEKELLKVKRHPGKGLFFFFCYKVTKYNIANQKHTKMSSDITDLMVMEPKVIFLNNPGLLRGMSHHLETQTCL